jgi:hypothetical protein
MEYKQKKSLVKNSFFCCYWGKYFFLPSSSQKGENKACEILLSLSLCVPSPELGHKSP